MNQLRQNKMEFSLERVISNLLLIGVIASLLLEISGIILYYRTYHTLAVSFDAIFNLQGHNFFSYLLGLLNGGSSGAAIKLMTLGVIALVLTPFFRVVLSVLFFAWGRNLRYVFITIFVLVVLTFSLTKH
jgi:uncharacterized membrane protein